MKKLLLHSILTLLLSSSNLFSSVLNFKLISGDKILLKCPKTGIVSAYYVQEISFSKDCVRIWSEEYGVSSWRNFDYLNKNIIQIKRITKK